MGTTDTTSTPTSAAEQAASAAEGTTTPTNTAETEKVTDSKTEAHTSSKEEPTFNKEGLLADLYKERSLRRQLRDKCAALETKLSSLTEVETTLQTTQHRYDRLEQFLLQCGGDVSKILDSRSFTQKLFDSDTSVEDLVSEWKKHNPTKTSSALGGSGSAEAKPTFNEILRAASKT